VFKNFKVLADNGVGANAISKVEKMKIILGRVLMSLLLSLLLTSCPGMDMGSFNFGSQGGTLDEAEQKAFNGRLDNALNELAAKNASPQDAVLSPFNGHMATNHVLKNLDMGNPANAETTLANADSGFGFQCQPDAENRDDNIGKYKQALKDFNHHAQMTGMLLNLQAFLDIQKHEQGFKEIPVGVARKAFLDAYPEPGKDIILPNDTKKSLDAIKEKHMKLMELKQALSRIRNARNDVIEKRRDEAKDLLDEYRSLKVDDELEQLVEEGGLHKDYLNSEIKGDLASVEKFLDFQVANDAGADGRTIVANRNADVLAEIAALEDYTHKQYDALMTEVYNQSGNIKLDDSGKNVYVKEFFDKSREELMEKSIEATGWSFDMEMKFDLMANVIEAKPEIDQQAVYANMQTLLKQAPHAGGNAQKATTFIRDYEKLQYLKGDKFFGEIFGTRLEELEQHIKLDEESVGEISSFRKFYKEMCGSADCELSDVFNKAYRQKEGFGNLVKALASMMQISPLDGPSLEKRLKSIHAGKELLKTKFSECNNAVTDENLKVAIKVKQEDYVRCNLLKDVISTQGLKDICGEDSSAYTQQRDADARAVQREAARQNASSNSADVQ
jgi:hypothetical protein